MPLPISPLTPYPRVIRTQDQREVNLYLRIFCFALLTAGTSQGQGLPRYSVTDLGTLGGSLSNAFGINTSGQVVGSSTTQGDTAGHAFLYSRGRMIGLGNLGGSGFGLSINTSGQIVGGSRTLDGGSHAFLYTNGTMTDLGTLGGSTSWATGINSSGQIVGSSYTPGDTTYHPFLYSGGRMTDLGTLGGSSGAYGINARGEIVGYDNPPGPKPSPNANRPFLYSGGRMIDLNSLLPANSGWMLAAAQAINDSGQIVGYGTINGQMHGFLLTPCGRPTFTGPYPGSQAPARGVAVNGWSMDVQVSDHDGLELDNVFLGSRYMAVKMNVPYYKLETSDYPYPASHCELNPNSTATSCQSRLVDFHLPNATDSAIEATYEIDDIQ